MKRPPPDLGRLNFRLDYHSAVPLHAQVEQLLRELITQPVYQQGQLLPDEVSLAKRLGISRSTLRAGIARLMYEGLLARTRGVGTRVTMRAHESGITQWPSFSREMERKGLAVKTFSMHTRSIPANEIVARALRLSPKAAVLQLDRLRGWGRKPVVHFRSYLPQRLGLTPEEDFSQPLYDIIEKRSGAAASHSHESMRAVGADAGLSKAFRVRQGTPLLQRTRVVFTTNLLPIEYAIVHYVSSRFALTLDIRRDEQ